MSEIIRSQPITLPAPRVAISVRQATVDDVSFMDALQKKHGKQLGFFPRAQMLGYIEGGHVLVAVDEATNKQVGYVASRDRYLKRDELGVIFQMCVAPEFRRSFVAANLLREVFERSSYGCRLYCCWCAQDLVESSRFWEAMGFVPIAYRAGGRGSRVGGSRLEGARPTSNNKPPASPRIHIFWQKRIRSGDNSTPYWFPAKTEGGAIREDRIVLPIPHAIGNRGTGMKWDDDLPILTPSQSQEKTAEPKPAESKPRAKAKMKTPEPALHGRPMVHYGAPEMRLQPPAKEVAAKPEKKRIVSVPRKCDPVLIAKARELRDKWLEQINSGGIALPSPKYDVAKALPAAVARIAA